MSQKKVYDKTLFYLTLGSLISLLIIIAVRFLEVRVFEESEVLLIAVFLGIVLPLIHLIMTISWQTYYFDTNRKAKREDVLAEGLFRQGILMLIAAILKLTFFREPEVALTTTALWLAGGFLAAVALNITFFSFHERS